MPFRGRDRQTIRNQYLADLSAEYAAQGRTLLVVRGSDAYMNGNALAAQASLLEAQAEQTSRDILPDQASLEALQRHAYVYGIPRRSAVASRLQIQCSGVDAVYNVQGLQFTAPDGVLLNTIDTTLTIAGGVGTVNVEAAVAGVSGNVATGTVVQWTAAPSGVNPTGIVTAITRQGFDQETQASWADRIVDRLRERPGSGNRSDWRAWAFDYIALDIHDAFVYPLRRPPLAYPGSGTANVLGCVSVVILGPPQGDNPVNTRLLGYAAGMDAPEVKNFIEGTRDANGNVVTDGRQLRPATIYSADYSIEVPNVLTVSVVLSLTVTPANAFPWSGTHAILSSTTTSVELNGDQLALAGTTVLGFVGTSFVRGGWQSVTLGAGVYNGATTTFTQGSGQDFLAAPTGVLRPAPGNWSNIRTAVFNLFDSLTPGDATPAERWPQQASDISPEVSTLFVSRITAAVQGVSGVLGCTPVAPAVDVVPTVKHIVTLNEFYVTP